MSTRSLEDRIKSWIMVANYSFMYRLRDISTATDILVRLLYAGNREIRFRAAEALGHLEKCTPKVGTALMNTLALDKDDLTRLAAAESLGLLRYRRVVPTLVKALKDKSQLVRGYAASSLGEIGAIRTKKVIVRLLHSEKFAGPKVSYCFALRNLGEPNLLPKILCFLSHKHYLVRCATANELLTYIDTFNHEEGRHILAGLRACLRHEPTVAVRSTLKPCIFQFEKKFGRR